MKNIKNLVLLVVCLFASTLLKAQTAKEVKSKVAAESEVKQPAPVDVNKIPVPQNSNAETPGMKPVKAQLFNKPADNPNATLTPEQVKTANGTAQKPAMVIAEGSIPTPANTKPAAIKEQ